jgi:hypothetical protein
MFGVKNGVESTGSSAQLLNIDRFQGNDDGETLI